jgi:hypothetical protein
VNTGIDRDEVRAVSRFADAAFARFRDEADMSMLLALINVWSLAGNQQDRRIVGNKILKLLNHRQIVDPTIAREVLRHVGTPVCTCPSVDAWRAIVTFLAEVHLLSVNIEALRAAVRLIKAGEQPSDDPMRESCRTEAGRLSHSPCPEASVEAHFLLAHL